MRRLFAFLRSFVNGVATTIETGQHAARAWRAALQPADAIGNISRTGELRGHCRGVSFFETLEHELITDHLARSSSPLGSEVVHEAEEAADAEEAGDVEEAGEVDDGHEAGDADEAAKARIRVGNGNRLHLGSEPVDERLEHRIELEFGGRSHRRGQLRRVIADGNHVRSGQQRHRQQY